MIPSPHHIQLQLGAGNHGGGQMELVLVRGGGAQAAGLLEGGLDLGLHEIVGVIGLVGQKAGASRRYLKQPTVRCEQLALSGAGSHHHRAGSRDGRKCLVMGEYGKLASRSAQRHLIGGTAELLAAERYELELHYLALESAAARTSSMPPLR